MQNVQPSNSAAPGLGDAPPTRRDRHAPAVVGLHWFSVAAVVVAAVAGLLREVVEQDAARNLLLEVHRQSGLFVLVALVLRLAARARFGLADHAGRMPALLRLAAVAAHLALYATLAAITLLGVATSHAHAVPVKLFGIIPLPRLAPEDSDLADQLSDWHVWAAWLLLGLVALHIAAAVWHHRIRKDGVLAAMLPWSRRP